MSTSTVALPTTDATTVDHTAEPQSNLWTSDSEREAKRTADTPAVEAVADEAPATAEESVDPSAGAADAQAETPAVAETPRDEAGKFKPKGRGHPRNDPEARVRDATAKEARAKEDARLAREELARLRAELVETQRKPAPKEAAEPPTADPIADVEKFWQDPLSIVEQRAQRIAREQAQAIFAEHQRQQALHEEHRQYVSRMEAFKETHPDFDMVVQQAPEVPGVILLAVQGSPRGPEIAYYLGSHPDIARQLAEDAKALSADAVPWVRRSLEAQLSPAAAASADSAPVTRPSAAKPPINRVGGTATATPVDPDDLEFGPEYIRRENQREKKAREAARW